MSSPSGAGVAGRGGSSCGGNAEQGQDKTPPGSFPDPCASRAPPGFRQQPGLIRRVFGPGVSAPPASTLLPASSRVPETSPLLAGETLCSDPILGSGGRAGPDQPALSRPATVRLPACSAFSAVRPWISRELGFPGAVCGTRERSREAAPGRQGPLRPPCLCGTAQAQDPEPWRAASASGRAVFGAVQVPHQLAPTARWAAGGRGWVWGHARAFLLTLSLSCAARTRRHVRCVQAGASAHRPRVLHVLQFL